jgi:hypothetical protein
MPESFVQVAPDSTGKRLRTLTRTVGGVEVHDQFVVMAGTPTYYFQTPASAVAQNRVYIDIFNAAGSPNIFYVRKVFIQLHYAAVTGVANVFEIRRTSTVGTGGTAMTPVKADTTDANLPAQLTARSASTGGATSAAVMCFVPLTAEETSTVGATSWAINAMPEGNETKDMNLNPGEGLSVVHTSNTTVGTYSVFVVLSTF